MKLRSKLALCSAFACVLSGTTVNAQTYHWARKSNPFTLQVIDSVTPGWDYSLFTSVQQWSNSQLLDLKIASSDDSTATRQTCEIVQGKVHVCNYAYGATGWLGLTTMGIDVNGHIDRARVRLNDSYPDSWLIVGKRNHVACHEIGHGLGLKHTSEDGTSQATCMDLSNSALSQWPGTVSFNTLTSIYGGHIDSYNTFYGGATTTTTTAPTTDTNTSGPQNTKRNSTTSAASPTSICTGKDKKNCPSSAFAIEDDYKKGRKISQSKKEEIWTSPRDDGGMWIHHVQLP